MKVSQKVLVTPKKKVINVAKNSDHVIKSIISFSCTPGQNFCIDKKHYTICNDEGTGPKPGEYLLSTGSCDGLCVGEGKAVEICSTKPKCGDGVVDHLNEECDDGNSKDGDFCTSKCTFTSKVQKIKVLVVSTCDSDGTRCSKADGSPDQKVKFMLKGANGIHEKSGTNIRFVMDPETNFGPVITQGTTKYRELISIKNTVLNAPCLLKYSPSALEQITNKDLNKDGKYDINDLNVVCDTISPTAARTSFYLEHPNSIIVFVQGNRDYVAYEDGHWKVIEMPLGLGSYKMPFIFFGNIASGELLNHEAGHVLGLKHTFRDQPDSITEAAEIIKEKIVSNNINPNDDVSVKNLFDGDYKHGVYDTPAYLGSTVVDETGNKVCGTIKVNVPVILDGKTYTYTFDSDRANPMGYNGACYISEKFSPGQAQRMYQSLQTDKKDLTFEEKKLASEKISLLLNSISESAEEIDSEIRESTINKRRIQISKSLVINPEAANQVQIK